jgi:hypothetical protein
VICSWTERFDLVLEDLRALSRDPPIVAEGAGLFPALVAPLVARPQQAIWLVPTAAFCATMRRRRGSAMPAQTSDPERAWGNLIARDVLLARYVRQRAAALGLAVVEIHGSRSIDEVAIAVAEHVGLGLSALKDRRNSSRILHPPRQTLFLVPLLRQGVPMEGQPSMRSTPRFGQPVWARRHPCAGSEPAVIEKTPRSRCPR